MSRKSKAGPKPHKARRPSRALRGREPIAGSAAPEHRYVMSKPGGPSCNLACTYCYYQDKLALYPGGGPLRMSNRVLELFTRQYIRMQEAPSVLFAWQGGEPLLLGRSFFERALVYQRKYAGGKRVDNSLQTNGTLLGDDWCRFFKDNGFLIGVSLDGPEHVHDRYRRTVDGRPTFAGVMPGVELLQEHGVEFNTLSVVNDYSVRFPLEVYRFLKDAGSRYMQFIPAVGCASEVLRPDGLRLLNAHQGSEHLVTEWSVRPLDYGRFLSEIYDEWVGGDVGSWFVQFFDSVLSNWCGLPPGVCVIGRDCGRGAVIEHNGDVYACDHFVFPENRLGNIRETPLAAMLLSERQREFGRRKSEALTSFCRRCEYLSLCWGECPKNRFALSAEGEPGHNYLCAGLRHFYGHTEPTMRFMAHELRSGRPASNVMSRPAPARRCPGRSRDRVPG
jgi:uncharacterized protein